MLGSPSKAPRRRRWVPLLPPLFLDSTAAVIVSSHVEADVGCGRCTATAPATAGGAREEDVAPGAGSGGRRWRREGGRRLQLLPVKSNSRRRLICWHLAGNGGEHRDAADREQERRRLASLISRYSD
ncbi:hypothetical protein E2562_013750 [Oryza meyeriana var. granulata]|uniref:Uncharacterized protein n=1 Tax=Oryza meyeriana var. granulata TaxID=110450 RepID=A0A6G1BKR5_9ORYZ|nr:hypothetical protein E2562_013750 [Oryza meyeriana var. granulata]